jgi:F-type H+-transporting ATPase subunit d
MSGAGKKVADVALKASRTIDWDGMAKLLVSDEARKEFSTLRRAFDEVNSTLQTKFSQVQTTPFLSHEYIGEFSLDLCHF